MIFVLAISGLQHEGRPCGFGQSLGQFLIFFFVGQKDFVQSQRLVRFFLSTLWIFLSRLWLEGDQFSKMSEQKSTPVSQTGPFFWLTKRNEKLTKQLDGQRNWPKPHGRPYSLNEALEPTSLFSIFKSRDRQCDCMRTPNRVLC